MGSNVCVAAGGARLCVVMVEGCGSVTRGGWGLDWRVMSSGVSAPVVVGAAGDLVAYGASGAACVSIVAAVNSVMFGSLLCEATAGTEFVCGSLLCGGGGTVCLSVSFS